MSEEDASNRIGEIRSILESDQKEKPAESAQLDSGQKSEGIVSQKIAEGSIEGQISCVEGPVGNATVLIGVISTSSDPKGNFLLEHLPVGIGNIKVKSPSRRFYDSTLDVLVEPDKRNKLSIFLGEVTGNLEGTITDETGNLLVGAEVSGLLRLGKDAMVAKTDEKGHYIFTDVPAGSFFIRAKAQGYMTEGARVNVGGGSTSLSNFTLKLGALSITGKVLSKEGAPIDCEIYLTRNGRVVTKVRTSSSGDGSYAFKDLVPDSYVIGTISVTHRASGWQGKLEKDEIVNFDLEAMPPDSLSSTTTD